MRRIRASMRKLSKSAKAAVTAPHYPHCPKCGHAPLPAYQALPTACHACGLVLAKFGTALPSPVADQTAASDWTSEDGESRWAQFKARLTYVPEQVDAGAWWARLALLAVFAIWGACLMWMDYRIGEMGSSFLHGPLLVFHEAGHVIFRLFGEFMTIAGVTVGQPLMPAILAGAQGIGCLIHKLGALTAIASIAWAEWILRKQQRLTVKQLDA